MTASKMDYLIEVLNNRTYNPISYDILVKEKVEELYRLLDNIKPLSDDEYKILYFSIPKGNMEEYDNYEEFNRFNKEYPDEIYWYKMITSRYKNYYTISINSKNILYADMNKEDSFENYQLQELLDFLIIKVKECVVMLENGTYNEYIKNNYSYKNRFGVIKRSKYWKLYPKIKEDLLNRITEKEINYFIENAKGEINNRIKNMTSSKYFECVSEVYKNIGYDTNNLTDKELYLKYSDGRDDGLSKIDENSSNEFNEWYNDNEKFGGHPWEIIRGHSFSRVNLQVCNDEKGYYLSLDGSKLLRKIEIVKIFNILNKNNIPIKINNVEKIKNALKGVDYLGIVPNEIIPIQCGGYFNKYNPTEFIHIDDPKIYKYIKWEPLENIELKDNKNG